jgi:hypothetical protein
MLINKNKKDCNHPTCQGGKCRRLKAKPISKRSKAMADQMKIYNQRRRKFLIEWYLCDVVTCENHSTEIHHKKGRGKYLLDETTWMAVCRVCHAQIENNPEWAKAKGYSLSRLSCG